MKVLTPKASHHKAAREATKAYKASGIAKRYKDDDTAKRALAILLLLAELDVVVGMTGAKAKREYVATPGAIVAQIDWTVPDASPTTRPDQGFERRLHAALAAGADILPKAIGWGWVDTEDQGFVMIRTA